MVKDGNREIPYGLCHCGCGEKTRIATVNDKFNGTVKGEPMRYIKHHFRKGRARDGDVPIYQPDHPRANKQGYVPEHILVAEEILGRPLNPGEVVHHKDGKHSNNSPENIEVFENNGQHLSFHAQEAGPSWGQPLRCDYVEAEKVYRTGMCVSDVARLFGVSRQAMWKALRCRGVLEKKRSSK